MNRRTELESVHIRNEVIGSIASLAALEVEGIVGIWKGPLLFRSFPGGAGVRVEIQDREVRIWISLVAEYGMPLPQVAVQVQERVRDMVEQMTQLSAVEVHVVIHEIKQKRS